MVAAIGAVAGVAGAAMSASGARSAANTQSAASDRATMLQMQAAAQQRQDLAPWTSAGGAAQSRLNQYMGIGGVGSSGVTSMGLGTGLSPDQVRQQLMSRYTKNGVSGGSPGGLNLPPPSSPADAYNQMLQYGNYASTHPSGGVGSDGQPFGPGQGPGYWEPDSSGVGMDNAGKSQRWVSTAGQQGNTSTVDEEGLNAAIAKYYEEQNAQNAALQNDPTYGSLLRAYRNGEEFDPGPAFSFKGENLASDPGYQFGLNQGTQGIDRGQASRGNFLSGAAMKELARFNEDYAGTKFNDAFNRNLTTHNTNLGARQQAWNTNLNAYDNNRSRVYSFLTGVSGMGQASAAGVASGNQQAASNIGSNMLGSANAQAAGQVAGGNALQSGINSAVNSYNSNNLNSTAGWNNMLANNNMGRSGNNYNGSSNNSSAANYTNSLDGGVTW
jgi:hypothetical protein